MPLDATARLLAPLDLGRLRGAHMALPQLVSHRCSYGYRAQTGLGAKLGERVKKELGCNTVGELAAVSAFISDSLSDSI